MAFAATRCPNCGAPLPARESGAFHCPYCSVPLVPVRDGVQVLPSFEDEPLEAPDRPRLWLGGARWRIEGRLARGERSDVFLALRDHRLTERVVARVLRTRRDAARLERAHEVLSGLQRSSARGAEHFSRLVPQPVAFGEARLGARGEDGGRLVSLVRFESGFVHTFDDVRTAHPRGIPATAAVWLYKRALELLSFVHESGWVHGAVLPRHLLVHARDHGVQLAGWSHAVRPGASPPPAADDAAFRPAMDGPGLDVAMAARAVLWLLGGSPTKAPASTPAPLARLLEDRAARDDGASAWQVRALVDAASAEAFGPKKFVPFPLPGWNITAD